MSPIRYVTAATPAGAVRLAQADQGRFLGGGIDLLGELKEYLTTAGTLVNIKNLPGTREIQFEGGKAVIGANVTISGLASDPEVASRLRAVREAASEVGSPQIRNVATLGGNLAQHSRCWYYRHRDVSCLKKGGATCYARDGESKFSSIFSGNPCISPTVSNLGVALTALGASAVILRGGKELTITLPELYEKAWENPKAHNSLAADDLILRIEVPLASTKSAYLQVAEKSDFDWALVSCAAALELEGSTVKRGKVVLGAVAPVPYQSEAVNRFLTGKALSDETASQAADLLLKEATPFKDNGYKVPVARALIRRTLLGAST